MSRLALTCLLLAAGLAGCSSSSSGAFRLEQNLALEADALLLGGALIYFVYDPLAPNWEIVESRLADGNYRFTLKMKRFHTGGSGEALSVLRRRLALIQAEQGLGEYSILSYEEGIDSSTLTTHRYAEATVRFLPSQGADSFALGLLRLN